MLEKTINKIKENKDYQKLNNFFDKDLFLSYSLLGEVLNPNKSYSYKLIRKYIWEYEDINKNKFYVRLNYQPTKNPYFEIKTFWIDKKGKKIYDYLPDNVTGKDWHKRGNTVAKIYRDEIIPVFDKQNISDVLKIKPIDISRYQFSIRMVNKLTPNKFKIEENKPKEIVIKK